MSHSLIIALLFVMAVVAIFSAPVDQPPPEQKDRMKRVIDLSFGSDEDEDYLTPYRQAGPQHVRSNTDDLVSVYSDEWDDSPEVYGEEEDSNEEHGRGSDSSEEDQSDETVQQRRHVKGRHHQDGHHYQDGHRHRHGGTGQHHHGRQQRLDG